MAKLRPAACYRRAKRPHSRISKYKEKSYVKGVPGIKIRKFEMGTFKGDFDYEIGIKSCESLQIRHNALEAFRTSANKQLDTNLGKINYYLKIKSYPHQVMRHNPMANFAGADRFSSGMAHCYGKPLGRAAVVKKGQVIIITRIPSQHLEKAKKGLKIAIQKLPCKCSLVITKLKTIDETPKKE